MVSLPNNIFNYLYDLNAKYTIESHIKNRSLYGIFNKKGQIPGLDIKHKINRSKSIS